MNFHPDRLTALGMTVAEGLHISGRYLSQYVTGFSNGGRTAVSGGHRQRWEHDLFHDTYDDAAPTDMPIYGSLDLLLDPHGGSPRFGSSFIIVRDHVRERTTFCVGDSHTGPTDVGTIEEPLALLAGLVEQASQGNLLGRQLGLDELSQALSGRVKITPGRVLDSYVEAQVHGGISLSEDVDAIILDPSFRRTATSRTLLDAANRYGFALDWHSGSELDPARIPRDFRLADTPDLAQRIARDDGLVDAACIGVAARAHPVEPPTPEGDPDHAPLQQLKYVWHAVLALGTDSDRWRRHSQAAIMQPS